MRPQIVGLALTLAIALAFATAAFVLLRDLRFALYAPSLDIAQTTLASLATAAVAALSFARFREHGDAATLLEASAFIVLALANLANELAALLGIDRDVGATLDAPGQLPLYFWAAVRLLSSALLFLASQPPSRARALIAHPRLALTGPSIGIGLVAVAVWAVHDDVPVLVSTDVLRQLANETFSLSPLPGINVGILLLDGTAAALLVGAAIGYARTPSASGIPSSYLVVGLVFAAFSQLHFVLYPAVYSGLVSTGDALRIAFYLVLAAGIQAATRRDIRALREANDRLQVLATAEADRTAMAERTRLARELHDGLAQDLWTANLEFRRAKAELPGDPDTVRATLASVQDALDAALLEARNAVHSLRSGFDAGMSLADELPRRLDAFAERTGYPIDLELDPALASMTGVPAAEIIRVVEEALTNVHKHADATRISVRATRRDDEYVVSVDDNGRGFNPAVTRPGHGLTGMRERAVLLDGRLVVRSAPGDGTSVQLVLPPQVVG